MTFHFKQSGHAFLCALLVAALSFTTSGAVAEYPEKSVGYIIPFGPGGESDITARHQQSFFKKLYGQDLVISYKPGGGGAVGWSQLNEMRGDGYTIMGINLPHIIIKPRQKNVGFETDDIEAVYMFHYTPDAIVVADDSPFNTLAELTSAAKKDPGGVTFSGSGKGTANHLAQVRFDKMADIQTTYVPFKEPALRYRHCSAIMLPRSGDILRWVPSMKVKFACWQWRWKNATLVFRMFRHLKN